MVVHNMDLFWERNSFSSVATNTNYTLQKVHQSYQTTAQMNFPAQVQTRFFVSYGQDTRHYKTMCTVSLTFFISCSRPSFKEQKCAEIFATLAI